MMFEIFPVTPGRLKSYFISEKLNSGQWLVGPKN
jgi:hypothetical protein